MQPPKAQRASQPRARVTTDKLLKAARKLFAEKGFAAASTPAIVNDAGVTRGALYHHFTDKRGLFRAVLELEAEAVAAEIRNQTARPKSAARALKEGSQAYFQAISKPGRAQLLLLEGPAVLGTKVMAEIDAKSGGNELRRGLDLAVQLGELAPTPTVELAEILSAAFDRAALSVAVGADSGNYIRAIDTLLQGLLKK